jgi:hypothetical protein
MNTEKLLPELELLLGLEIQKYKRKFIKYKVLIVMVKLFGKIF